jgi:nucleolar protein 9
LFIKSAPIVTKELTTPLEQEQQAPDNGEVYVSMENLFLYTLNELEGNLGYLMTDKFASHALRVLLVVLSGQPLAKSSTTSLLASKRKENIGIAGIDNKPDGLGLTTRTVPDSFHLAVDKMIADTVAGLDTTYLRALATHPIGNPVLQLLLELELTRSGKQKAKDEKSVFHKLLPDNPPEEGTESASFIQGLVYDSVGSRLLETIVRFAPGKTFKVLYRSLFKERLGSLARNEVAGFLVERILERLSKEDLEEAVQAILPQVESLVERSRTSLIRIMIERCVIRNVETSSIAEALEIAYGSDPPSRLTKMLKLTGGDSLANAKETSDGRKDKDPGRFMARSGADHAFSTRTAKPTYRGQLTRVTRGRINQGCERPNSITRIANVTRPGLREYALSSQHGPEVLRTYDRAGYTCLRPHVVDCFWIATHGLTFVQERIAENSWRTRQLYETHFWKGSMEELKMDMYKRKKLDWIVLAKVVMEAKMPVPSISTVM